MVRIIRPEDTQALVPQQNRAVDMHVANVMERRKEYALVSMC